MESRAAIAGHPLHALFVNYPIALLTTALLFDLIFLWRRETFWRRGAFWLMVLGELGALAAIVPGLIDYFAIAMPGAVRQTARIHLILGLAIAALYALQIWLRRHEAGPAAGALKPRFLALGVFSAVAVLAQGAIGGHLSHVDRVGVEPAPVEVQSGVHASAALLEHGRTVYQVHCTGCHGERGRGASGPRLSRSGLPVEDIRDAVVTGRAPAMPSFKGTLSNKEIDALLAYVRQLAVGGDAARTPRNGGQ